MSSLDATEEEIPDNILDDGLDPATRTTAQILLYGLSSYHGDQKSLYRVFSLLKAYIKNKESYLELFNRLSNLRLKRGETFTLIRHELYDTETEKKKLWISNSNLLEQLEDINLEILSFLFSEFKGTKIAQIIVTKSWIESMPSRLPGGERTTEDLDGE